MIDRTTEATVASRLMIEMTDSTLHMIKADLCNKHFSQSFGRISISIHSENSFS